MTKYSIILLGAVGVGKGTQARKLMNYFGIPQISTGDILRAEVAAGTEVGLRAKDIMNRGELVPDDVIVEIVKRRLLLDDAVKGAIFDGFPRTIPQAEALDGVLLDVGLPPPKVVTLEVPNEIIVDRLASRRVCLNCGATFSVKSDPNAATSHKCSNGNAQVIQRDDDMPDTVRQRLKVYTEKTAPLINFYKKAGHLRQINGIGSENEIFARVLIALDPELS